MSVINSISPMMGASGGAAASPGFLGDIEGVSLDTNIICCLDAGAEDSYDGSSQDWLDLTETNIDWWRGTNDGAAANDPAFNGTSGNESSSEYFSFDGGDWLTVKTQPAGFQLWHKDNAEFTAVFWIFIPTGGMNNSRFISDCTSNAASTGFKFGTEGSGTSDDFFCQCLNSTTSPPMTGTSSETAHVTENAWNMIAVSIDEAAGAGGSFFYKRAGASSTIDTFNAAYASPSTGSATFDMHIGADGGTGSPVVSGTRMAGVFLFSTNLSQANLDSIYTATNRSFV